MEERNIENSNTENKNVENGNAETNGRKRNILDWFRDFLKRWPKIHELFCKYEEILVYLVVGVLNTIVSWGAWFICAVTILDAQDVTQNVILSIISWVAGVVFGYFMNRIFVFKSNDPHMLKEFLQFSGGRVSTWALDAVLMVLMVNILSINEIFSKIVSSVLVMIGNYVISKFFVFKKKN